MTERIHDQSTGRLVEIADSLDRLIMPDVRGSEKFCRDPLAILGIYIASMPIGFVIGTAVSIGAVEFYKALQLPAETRFLASLVGFFAGWAVGYMGGIGAVWRLSARCASLNLPKPN